MELFEVRQGVLFTGVSFDVEPALETRSPLPLQLVAPEGVQFKGTQKVSQEAFCAHLYHTLSLFHTFSVSCHT